ncbi:TPA: hypothetical protein SLE31_004611 [Citrobacter freundii]|nr:hypothetical protein [Citrobacter freundii]
MNTAQTTTEMSVSWHLAKHRKVRFEREADGLGFMKLIKASIIVMKYSDYFNLTFMHHYQSPKVKVLMPNLQTCREILAGIHFPDFLGSDQASFSGDAGA